VVPITVPLSLVNNILDISGCLRAGRSSTTGAEWRSVNGLLTDGWRALATTLVSIRPACYNSAD